MSVISAVFLGFIQGVAEFLPISSSGHLSVLQNFFHFQTIEQGHMLFDVLLHIGTLAAIVVAYWKDIVDIVLDSIGWVQNVRTRLPMDKRGYPGARLLVMLFFGTLPLFVILPVNDMIERLYYKSGFIGAAFILTGCMLWVSDRMPRGKKTLQSMTIKDALLIGLCQAVATIPGISRSGSTITAGIATGQKRSDAMKYSLLMSLPAVLGANFLTFLDALKDGIIWSELPVYLLGTAVAFGVGYVSIRLLQRILNKGKFGYFSYYLWGVGLIVLIASIF